uniref:Reverse transcriptase domain-containing protein n=1 Tax=Meloidogyne incognita TaxID=6306 RepID=A0A914LP73_MELIC
MGITFQKAFNKKNSELVIGSNFSKSDDRIEDIQFNILDIFKLLRKLPNKNSTSPDSVPYILLKKCAFPLSHIITELFRLILDEGEIPEIWKHSIVIPIFKKGDKTITDNYRPIALTCTLCRTFERLLANKLIEFLRNKDFFSIEQFGFLKQRSTVTQLLTMLNQIYSCVDRGNKVDIVYIDFKKAFDTVPIELLIQKVKYIGIDGKILKFLINFLNNRKFKVRIEQDFYEEYPIYSGVPQGSVLGPLLFVIFINDLPEHLPKGVNIKIYADDIKLYVEHNNDNNRNKLKESLLIIEKWAKNNGLRISIDKCVCLYIGKNNDKQQYFIDGLPIKKENCVRDLGILIDTDLSFSAHITKITKQAYSMIVCD